jgi:DNA-binding NtrC family response regulator
MAQLDGMTPRILVVDDDSSFREVLCFDLAQEGYEVTAAPDGKEALRLFEEEPFGVVVTDLKMPRLSGQALLEMLQKRAPDTVVVVITAFGDMETAVKAMKAGAFDFLPKPCERAQLKLTVRRAVEHAGLRREVHDLKERLGSGRKPLLYRSEAMEAVVALADRVAATDATVLIRGESGTGKELVARRIHRASSRRGGPFVALNCGAIPRDLLEDELFGHVKGAFTGATKERKGRFSTAEGGTIFLDEIGELPLELQSRLLRVLQERTIDVVGADEPVAVDVRIVAATARDLEADTKEGRFREDLYFRLNVVPVVVPPLRERSEDVLLLAEHFLRGSSGGSAWEIPPEARRRLEALPWRGNVRELENLCQRLAVLCDDRVVDVEMLPSVAPEEGAVEASVSPAHVELPAGGASLSGIEKAVIVRALEMNGHNQSRTARFLQIPRHVLLYRIEKHGIAIPGRKG